MGEKYSLAYPKLYVPGLSDMWFNKKIFAFSLVEGLLTSCILFFVSYFTLTDGVMADGKDLASGASLAFMTASILIITVTFRVGMVNAP